MIIEIDVNLIKKLDLTLNQYVFSYLLVKNKKDFQTITKKITNLLTDRDIQDLKTKQILTEQSTLQNAHPTTEFEEIVASPEDYFKEFFDNYPSTVTRPDGVKDYLKNNIKKSRELYQKTVGKNEEMHRHLLECLKFDIENKRKTNSIKFMKKMYNWLSQEEWRSAEELLKDNVRTTQQHTGYGTDIE